MKWKNKKVLVTGGAGFIGSHLVEKLVSLGSKVIVIDLLSKFDTLNLENVRKGIKFLSCDVSNHKEVNTINQNVDYVFHLAAVANPRECEKKPKFAFRNNVIGTFNILEYALSVNVKKFVFTSSALLYGDPEYIPIDEKHSTKVGDSVYSITKKYGEELCDFFKTKYGLPTLYFRLFNSFGPRQTTEYFIPTLITQALNDGIVELWTDKPTRDFTFVKDTVDALIKGAESELVGGPINVGSGKELNVGDIAKSIASIMDCKIKFLNKATKGPSRLCCNNELIHETLGWKPETPFKNGLEKTINWYKKNA